jgi:hypothetical protein
MLITSIKPKTAPKLATNLPRMFKLEPFTQTPLIFVRQAFLCFHERPQRASLSRQALGSHSRENAKILKASTDLPPRAVKKPSMQFHAEPDELSAYQALPDIELGQR